MNNIIIDCIVVGGTFRLVPVCNTTPVLQRNLKRAWYSQSALLFLSDKITSKVDYGIYHEKSDAWRNCWRKSKKKKREEKKRRRKKKKKKKQKKGQFEKTEKNPQATDIKDILHI